MSINKANLYRVFAERFPDDLDRPLLVMPNGTVYSYRDAEGMSARAANFLFAQGLLPGDRVTVQVDKSPEMLWFYLGVVRAGLVFHPLNTAYTTDELSYFLGDAEPALVVCDPGRQQEIGGLCGGLGLPAPYTLDASGEGSLSEGLAGQPESFATADTAGNDMAALLYSSGTTGRPKGIMLSHANLIDNARVLSGFWGFTGQDRLLHALPIFHVHGLFVAIGCVLMSGASMRWLPRFDVQAALAGLADSTVLMGVPTYYTRLLAEADFNAEVCSNIRLFISGSAPLLAETFREFEERTGQRILERYGMTETGMNTSNPLDGERKPGTVGPPLPGVSLRIMGSDGNAVESGEVGNIQVKGPNVFSGYWRMPEKTAEDFTDDGYFITGDKGQIDADGYVAIVGRAKDMVITGGLNVYPKEVELIINEVPGVLESAVIGVPHSDFGEAVTAVVVCEQGAELSVQQVIDHVRAVAAKFKVPKAVHFVDELPRNTMGKVQKNRLREKYSKAGARSGD